MDPRLKAGEDKSKNRREILSRPHRIQILHHGVGSGDDLAVKLVGALGNDHVGKLRR